MKNKALFLDRDGTINVEKNYVFRIEDFKFRDGIFELIREFFTKGYLIFVITNQAGIARGYYSADDFHLLNDWMVEQFRLRGITITAVYFCPHHPNFSGECDCRKPKPGMILSSAQKYSLALDQSFVVGDKWSDIEAGKTAGCKTVLVLTGHGKGEFTQKKGHADYIAENLLDAVEHYILLQSDV